MAMGRVRVRREVSCPGAGRLVAGASVLAGGRRRARCADCGRYVPLGLDGRLGAHVAVYTVLFPPAALVDPGLGLALEVHAREAVARGT